MVERGASDLASHVADLVDSTESSFKTLYDDEMSCGIRLGILLRSYLWC
jgi:formyltetrahydrofolate synthetase